MKGVGLVVALAEAVDQAAPPSLVVLTMVVASRPDDPAARRGGQGQEGQGAGQQGQGEGRGCATLLRRGCATLLRRQQQQQQQGQGRPVAQPEQVLTIS